MSESRIPVDLRNPGQVFACLGLMEASEILCAPGAAGLVTGGFDCEESALDAHFVLSVPVSDDPLGAVLDFLRSAEVLSVSPQGSSLSASRWGVRTITRDDPAFPSAEPDSPATLPGLIGAGDRWLPLSHWADDPSSCGRDAAKFWAGASGYPGVAFARDALALIRSLDPADCRAHPFDCAARQSSSFRFEWRRDYTALDAGFSPNKHADVAMVGYPIVEVLAAIGLQNARPVPHDKLTYSYGVSNAMLPLMLARAVLGGEAGCFPVRRFRMRLGWPGQEGQARHIIEAEEIPA